MNVESQKPSSFKGNRSQVLRIVQQANMEPRLYNNNDDDSNYDDDGDGDTQYFHHAISSSG